MLACKLPRRKREQERAASAFLSYYEGEIILANMVTYFSFQHTQRIYLLIINISALGVNKLRRNRSSSTCFDALTYETLEVEEESCESALRLVMAKSGGRSPAERKRRLRTKYGMKNDDDGQEKTDSVVNVDDTSKMQTSPSGHPSTKRQSKDITQSPRKTTFG